MNAFNHIRNAMTNNIAHKDNIYSQIISLNSTSPCHFPLRKVIVALSCIFMLTIGLGIFVIWPNFTKQSNEHSEIKMQVFDKTLYYTDTKGVYAYDPKTKTKEQIIKASVTESYVTSNFIFYSTNEGFFKYNRNNEDNQRIADRAIQMIEYNEMLYFIDYTQTDVIDENDKHHSIGVEKQLKLYGYNYKNNELSVLKSDYVSHTAQPRDIYMRDMYINEYGIYFWNTPDYGEKSNIYLLSLDGKSENIIYTSNTRNLSMDVGKDGLYLMEDQWDQQGNAWFAINRLSFSGNELNISDKIQYDFESGNAVFSSEIGSYYVYSNKLNQVYSFSSHNPSDKVKICDLNLNEYGNMQNLVFDDGNIYISSYNAYGHANKKYIIIHVHPDGTYKTIAKDN